MTNPTIVFEHDNAYYHQLLDMFLVSAKKNPNSFLEFRIQSLILRHKFSTTTRPSNNSNGLVQHKPSFYNIPPPQINPIPSSNGPSIYQRQPPPKRRYTAIFSPPIQRPTQNTTNQQKNHPNSMSPSVGPKFPLPPFPNPKPPPPPIIPLPIPPSPIPNCPPGRCGAMETNLPVKSFANPSS